MSDENNLPHSKLDDPQMLNDSEAKSNTSMKSRAQSTPIRESVRPRARQLSARLRKLIPFKKSEIHPELDRRVSAVIKDLRETGWQPIIREGYRTTERQHYLHTKPKATSGINLGFHNITDSKGRRQAMAVDIWDKRYGDPKSNEPHFKDAQKFFRALEKSAIRNGLISGLRWKNSDGAHVQLSRNSSLKSLVRKDNAVYFKKQPSFPKTKTNLNQRR
jgi:hypothetical protein